MASDVLALHDAPKVALHLGQVCDVWAGLHARLRNRLLRKLQTGSLGESERRLPGCTGKSGFRSMRVRRRRRAWLLLRQSVLNKCLWEYLRPGCGIALVFCASPLQPPQDMFHRNEYQHLQRMLRVLFVVYGMLKSDAQQRLQHRAATLSTLAMATAAWKGGVARANPQPREEGKESGQENMKLACPPELLH